MQLNSHFVWSDLKAGHKLLTTDFLSLKLLKGFTYLSSMVSLHNGHNIGTKKGTKMQLSSKNIRPNIWAKFFLMLSKTESFCVGFERKHKNSDTNLKTHQPILSLIE